MLCARIAPLPAAEAQVPPPGEPRFEMEEIVVTGAVVQDPVREVPRNVTVITADDIAQAPSNNVVDLLAREAGVSLKSFFGHDKQSGIDLRGMGDTAGSNVIVMVDGVRLNPADSAGPDFSAIPLDQIERIEIVRGAGSVVYGDGAVGGVVDIITRTGGAGPERRLYGTYGSDDAFDGRGSWRGTLDRLTYNLYAGYYDTEGYRDNGFYRKTDAGGRFGFDLSERLDLRLGAFWHQDDYGLPGPVSREDFESDERRTRTNFPDDAGKTRDVRLTGGLDWQPAGRGVLSIDGAYRSRENRFVLGYTPLLSRAAQTDAIDEDTGSLALRYHTDYALWGLDHELLGGADYFTTDYRRDALSQNERKTGDVEDLGLFLMNRWSLSDRLRVRFGYRYDRYQGRFRTDQRRRVDGLRVWVPGVPVDRRWTNSALDVGAVYDFTPDDTVFASYATSFRNPNVDELALAEEDLRPQNGHHVEIGLRHQAVGRWEAALTFFQTKITDEIYYGEDPETRTIVNRNYEDKTLRRGLEVEAKWYFGRRALSVGQRHLDESRIRKFRRPHPLGPGAQGEPGAGMAGRRPAAAGVDRNLGGLPGRRQRRGQRPVPEAGGLPGGRRQADLHLPGGEDFCGDQQHLRRTLRHPGLQRSLLPHADAQLLRRGRVAILNLHSIRTILRIRC